MMKILSFLNVSNISNLEADSGYVFSRLVLHELIKCGHEVVFIGPQNMPNLASEIEVIEIDFPHSKYGVRFGFPWHDLQTRLSAIIDGVDIIIVNQSELTVPLAMMVYEMIGKRIPCVTYYHYLAVQDIDNGTLIYDPSLNDHSVAHFIWQRQVESARFSDCNIIGSEFGKNLFLDASSYKDGLEEKFVVIPPPVPDCIDEAARNSSGIPTILYNHRLYEHYGTRQIFGVLAELSSCHTFEVLVTDPTYKRSLIRDKLDGSVSDIKRWVADLPFTRVHHAETQTDYCRAIASSDIALAPLRVGALWSMAMADAMSMSIPVVAPDKGAYLEVVGDRELLYSSYEEMYAILDNLLSNPILRKSKGAAAKQHTQLISAELIGERFESVLSSLVMKGK
jgi:glycosyltransferase involved in cell wall biosynthesis